MMNQNNIDAITALCTEFGYQPTSQDFVVIQVLWDGIQNEFCHSCNIPAVPSCDIKEVERVTAFRFLFGKLRSGGFTGAAVDAIVHSVAEGDTTVTYANGSKSNAEYLAEYFQKQSVISPSVIACHRKLVW